MKHGGKRSFPRGVEVMIKKAAVDTAFRENLLAERSRAAARIGLTLGAAEAAILDAAPEKQLNDVVARAKVPARIRAAFMGTAASAMLAALGAGEAQADDTTLVGGAVPDHPPAHVAFDDDLEWFATLKAPADAGAIAGVVASEGGDVIAGARIAVTGPSKVFLETDADGRFFLPSVPAGTYTIGCTRDGLVADVRDNVTVKDGYVTRVTFTLSVSGERDLGGIRPGEDDGG